MTLTLLKCQYGEVTVPYSEPINRVYSRYISFGYFLILSSYLILGLPSGFFPLGFPTTSLPFVSHDVYISSLFT